MRSKPPSLTSAPADALDPELEEEPPPHPAPSRPNANAVITARVVRARMAPPGLRAPERPILRRPLADVGFRHRTSPEKEHDMAELATSNARIAYEQTGQGPDIVWVSGGGDVGATWREWQVPSFPGYRHTTFDNRGAGKTECSQPIPWTIADFARDTAQL